MVTPWRLLGWMEKRLLSLGNNIRTQTLRPTPVQGGREKIQSARRAPRINMRIKLQTTSRSGPDKDW